ncbi:type II secretion system protein GspG [bacterium]|nr:type II secretion system protein GspG [bacterium]
MSLVRAIGREGRVVFLKTTDNFLSFRRFYKYNVILNQIMKIQSKGNKGISPRMARGFSLFEMVIVMGIIGLILGGAIYSMGRIKDSAAVSTSRQDMTSFSSALEAYKNIGGKYPSTSQGLEALLKRPQSSPRPRDWVQALDDEEALFDPWDTKYKYEYPGSKDPSRPEIMSAGPDKQFGSEDDMSSQKDPQN